MPTWRKDSAAPTSPDWRIVGRAVARWRSLANLLEYLPPNADNVIDPKPPNAPRSAALFFRARRKRLNS
jgi:hypothetical protein